MNQTTHLHKMIAGHYNGDPWIDVTLAGTLQDINADIAIFKKGDCNSIWQIVLHLAAWRETLLGRIKGEQIDSPENNFIEKTNDISEEAWSALKERLNKSQQNILQWLESEKEIDLDEKPGGELYTRQELIEAVALHDMYHLGQVVLLKKICGQYLNRN